VLQLQTILPRLGELQATSLLLVVLGQPPAQGLSIETEPIFSTDMLQLQLAKGETAHPANYRGCRHVKEGLGKRKSQRTPRTTTGRVFCSNFTTPTVLCSGASKQHTAKEATTSTPTTLRLLKANSNRKEVSQGSQWKWVALG
jgi:hypothetical protein